MKFDDLKYLSRDEYIKEYERLGDRMFSECYIPNSFDLLDKDNSALVEIAAYTGNLDDIQKSIDRTDSLYTEEESQKFMDSVLASNIIDIVESGMFYKSLMSATDDMRLIGSDCGDSGEEFTLPISEEDFNYYIRNHFVNELDEYVTSYNSFIESTKDFDSVHVRTILSCKAHKNHRCFCKKCLGLIDRGGKNYYSPDAVGLFATLMVTEAATQSSLDSMNKGITEKVTDILNQKMLKNSCTEEEMIEFIKSILKQIGYINIQSRYLQIALFSRFYLNKTGKFNISSISSSINRRNDMLARFIYRPNKRTFRNLILSDEFESDSIKTRIMLDKYLDTNRRRNS